MYRNLLILVFMLARYNLASCDDMTKDFKAIEEYLIKNVDSDELKLNFEAVEKWIRTPEKQICGLKIGCRRPVAATETLIHLYQEAFSSRKCSRETYELLVDNRNAAGIDHEWYTNYPKKYRVRALLMKIISHLIVNCMDQKVARLEKRIKKLDSERIGALKASFNKLLNELSLEVGNRVDTRDEDSNSVRIVQAYFDSDVFVGGAKRFMNFVEENTQLSTVGKTKKDLEDSLRGQINKFLYEFFIRHCKYYLDELSFVAEELVDFVHYKYRARQIDFSEGDKFYVPLGEYYMCKKFVEQTDKIIDVLLICKTGTEYDQRVRCY